MPDLIMCTEAAFLLSPEAARRSHRRRPPGRQFETFIEMQGIALDELDPAVRREAAERCASCASRKACRRWLRTGLFAYDGDPRCPNAGLMRH